MAKLTLTLATQHHNTSVAHAEKELNMENNPVYESIDPENDTVQNNCYQTQTSAQENLSKDMASRERIMNILGTIVITAMIVALVLIVLAVIILAALYGPWTTSQIQLEEGNLRELLNKTNCKSTSNDL